MNLKERAIHAPSVTVYLIFIQKGFKSTNRGIHIQQFTGIFSVCSYEQNKTKISIWTNSGWHTESLHTILLRELRTILNFYEIIYLVHNVIQGNPFQKEQILQPSMAKTLPSIASQKCPCEQFPLISIQCGKISKIRKSL